MGAIIGDIIIGIILLFGLVALARMGKRRKSSEEKHTEEAAAPAAGHDDHGHDASHGHDDPAPGKKDDHGGGGHGAGHGHHASGSSGNSALQWAFAALVFVIAAVAWKYWVMGGNLDSGIPTTRGAIALEAQRSTYVPQTAPAETPAPPAESDAPEPWHEATAPVGYDPLVLPGKLGSNIEVCRASDPNCLEPHVTGIRVRCVDHNGMEYGETVSDCTIFSQIRIWSTEDSAVPLIWWYKPFRQP